MASSKRYDIGKKGEKETHEYLKNIGFSCLSSKQRMNIVEAFQRCGISIRKSGFDAIDEDVVASLHSVDELEKRIEELCLYEVKTCGATRKAKVTPGFKGLGFTLTENEYDNAMPLGSRYRFLFVNLQNRTHRVCLLTDFFVAGRSRIYKTWSVFLMQDLPPANSHSESTAENR